MKKQVIMQVLPALQDGGVERGTIEIATALKNAGIKNYVMSNGGKMVPELDRLGVEHIALPVHSKNPIMMMINALRIAKIVKEKGITLMHVRSRAPAWSVRWASHLSGVPFMTTFHGVYGIKPRLLKQPYNSVMVSGRRVIAISEHVKKQLMKDYETNPAKIRLIHRGADTLRFDPKKVTQNQIAELMKKNNVPEDKPIIMVQGRLTAWKGQLTMLEALSLMKHKEVTCLFIGAHQGRTEYVKQLEEKISTLSKKTSVLMFSLLGKDMPTAYALSDVVASVSLKPEPFGRAMPEAQAMGRIVVAFNHGGACETVEDGKTGFLVKPGDAKDLAKKLDEVLDMSAAAKKKMADAAIKSVHDNFSIAKMQEKTLAVYKEIADETASKKK